MFDWIHSMMILLSLTYISWNWKFDLSTFKWIILLCKANFTDGFRQGMRVLLTTIKSQRFCSEKKLFVGTIESVKTLFGILVSFIWTHSHYLLRNNFFYLFGSDSNVHCITIALQNGRKIWIFLSWMHILCKKLLVTDEDVYRLDWCWRFLIQLRHYSSLKLDFPIDQWLTEEAQSYCCM